MKLRLAITKDGTSLYTGVYDVADADGFGKACADAWSKLIQERLRRDTSIGALMEHLESGFLSSKLRRDAMVERRANIGSN